VAKTLDDQAWWAWAGERIKGKLSEPDLDLTAADDPRAKKNGCGTWAHVSSHVFILSFTSVFSVSLLSMGVYFQ
jgi:hypothetical protein